MKHIFVMTAATAFALTGCVSMAPDYERPDAPIASSLPAQTSNVGVAAAGLGWRQFIADPALEGLIDTALTNNRDLRVAILNVQAAQAQYGITRSQRFPSIDAQGTVTDRGLFEDDGASQNPALQAQSVDQATAQLAVTAYELDLFGRVTSLNRAAQQHYFAAEENARAAQLSLIGAVSNGWLGLVTNTQLLALAQETASSQEESLNLTRARLEAGIASDLDYQRAVTSVEQARADTARYEAAVRQSLNALELLVGGPLPEGIAEAAAESEMSVRLDLYADQSSDILLSRPDVQAAENTLRAANAEIGAARAAFFPQISLTGSAGYASTELDNLFSSANGVWSYGPQVSLPIFSGGQNRANLRLAKTQREIALAQYEGAIQSAFRETADALAVADTIDDQIAALDRLVAASERAQFLSEQRLKDGVDNYLSVLDAQRAVYQAQQALISARLERSRNAVALYLALGGGQAGSI
ncbi:efflux transporter outer membrane subunit [Parvularcula marina]|uniref:Transporter n=1 Tax=Parvularcula marina TaxID=2292771 RepID=A0A371RL80_9PROT|nr:efflux transporter outer membrane subunit [Parvularcula marina]RFB06136.1 transporter [Parvularcula marina]